MKSKVNLGEIRTWNIKNRNKFHQMVFPASSQLLVCDLPSSFEEKCVNNISDLNTLLILYLIGVEARRAQLASWDLNCETIKVRKNTKRYFPVISLFSQ